MFRIIIIHLLKTFFVYMSIWLNYTHEKVGRWMVLPSYVYLLTHDTYFAWAKLFGGDSEEIKRFLDTVRGGRLLTLLQDSNQEQYFDRPGIRELLLEAYPYEVEMKCLKKRISNDPARNQRIMNLFNSFFGIDYQQVVSDYSMQADRTVWHISAEQESRTYTNRVHVVSIYLEFVSLLLRSQWYEQEALRHQQFADQHLLIEHVAWISGVTFQKWDKVVIQVGNTKYTTLIHELVHFTNKFFRFHYYDRRDIAFDNYTKTNEWLANFVAYHLMDAIIAKDVTAIERMQLSPLFFSVYIDIYATLQEQGSTHRKHNQALIEHEFRKFYRSLLTKRKANFYVQRFYKFFHYDQCEFLYPKELMYYLWYKGMLDLFASSSDKSCLLARCLLGKIAL